MKSKMAPTLEITKSDICVLKLGGFWDYKIPKTLLLRLDSIKLTNVKIKIELAENFDLDFCGGEILERWILSLESKNIVLENALKNHSKSQQIFQILATRKNPPKQDVVKDFIKLHWDSLQILKGFFKDSIRVIGFFGEILYAWFVSFLKPKNIRLKATLYCIQESLIKAIGIVALACFLIGVVIAYQGSIQLKQFGASLLIVEMSSMLTLREMAPIITAIIIAGRSASAFSAEIGMMKATQEIDAMRVMGFDPITFLVLPRMLVLCLVLPLVVFIADLFGLLGAMLVCQLQLGIGTEQFLERFLQVVDMRHFWVGIAKAPFFGLIISFIGCFHGFIVAKDTRSIGVHTTKSVVESIFLVIAFDAICSVIFTEMGW